MGAAEFSEVRVGKTMKAAFRDAVDEALYEYGHDIYSGTIGTKYDVLDAGKLPPRWKIRDFIDAVSLSSSKVGWKLDARERRLVERLKRDVPEPLRSRIVSEAEDKGGLAVGVQVTGTQAKPFKDRYERTRGRSVELDRRGREIPGTEKRFGPSARTMKVYLFLGTAPE